MRTQRRQQRASQACCSGCWSSWSVLTAVGAQDRQVVGLPVDAVVAVGVVACGLGDVGGPGHRDARVEGGEGGGEVGHQGTSSSAAATASAYACQMSARKP